MGLNTLGTESLLWNRSTLVCVLHFALRSAGRTKLPQRLFPQTPADVRERADLFLKRRLGIVSESAARQANLKHAGKTSFIRDAATAEMGATLCED